MFRSVLKSQATTFAPTGPLDTDAEMRAWLRSYATKHPVDVPARGLVLVQAVVGERSGATSCRGKHAERGRYEPGPIPLNLLTLSCFGQLDLTRRVRVSVLDQLGGSTQGTAGSN